MSNKLFRPDEMAALKASPHVESITNRSVCFTPEFKRLVYRELLSGKNISTVFEEHGIDTAALGTVRINGFLERLRKTGEREEGFVNLRHQRKAKTPEERNQSAEKRIRQLEAELAYTRQEVEFLKKLQAANLEAQKAWESKQVVSRVMRKTDMGIW